MSHNSKDISPLKLKEFFASNEPKKYDFLVFIGRFQPLHLGHCRVIEHALELSKNVLVFVGSTNSVRSFRNPFTYEERKGIIEETFPTDRIKVLSLDDFTYREENWIEQVQTKVKKAILENIPGNSKNVTLHGLNDVKIGLIGCQKDETSYYLNLFPEWASENVNFLNPLSSTDIRDRYFLLHGKGPDVVEAVPEASWNFLYSFSDTEDFKNLKKEYEFVEKYKRAWENAPYEPIFVTTDAVVVQSGYILLVRRNSMPGEGLMALPGGFLGTKERVQDSMIRELREETKLKVPDPVLRGSIRHEKVYDEPHRSSRGRTITHAFLIHLKPGPLPKVKGGDDARSAFWVPLADLDPKQMFEDHYFIVMDLIGKL